MRQLILRLSIIAPVATFSTPTYVPQDTTAVALTVTNGVGIMITNVLGIKRVDRIYAIPGRSYAVQYSSDMESWLTADPFIIAPANYVHGSPRPAQN